jgi:hypothetical protein
MPRLSRDMSLCKRPTAVRLQGIRLRPLQHPAWTGYACWLHT